MNLAKIVYMASAAIFAVSAGVAYWHDRNGLTDSNTYLANAVVLVASGVAAAASYWLFKKNAAEP